MRIAVTYENGEIFQHFGHTEQFKLYDVEDKKIVKEQVVDTMGSGHGALAGFLLENGVNALICGGIGGGAQNALAQAGIQLYGGVAGSADDAARAFRLIAEKGKPFYEYIIGGSAARPLKDFLVEMQRAVAPDIPFKFGSIPYAGVNLSLREFDCSQTERDTGFRAQVGFAEGCRRTMEWIKSEEAGNENI